MDPLIQLGPYKIDALIGEGGMGKVYRATDMRLHRTVAIKILPHDKALDPDRKRRFLQEARAASALNHPNIVTLYDIAEDAGVDFLVMEYVPGKPLDKLVAARKGLPLEEVVEYTIQIAGALAAAHAAGIVHRDIKPANVIVTAGESGRPGPVKVLDFGVAKLEERAWGAEAETRTVGATATESGMVVGTAAYMSPEQARGEPVDARTDLFSLGAVVYEMAAGRRPFAKTLDWTTPPTNPLPPELRPIVLKLLEADRDLRYQHASDLRADLQRLKRDTETAAAPARPKAETKTAAGRRWKMLLPAALSLAALAVAGYFYLRPAPKLTDKDTIVLADFKNTTGDAVFDETLRQGLSVQLAQSPFLSLVSEQHIRQTLRMMGQPADARLTPEIARDICQRTAGAAVLEGSIARLGSQYVLSLRAENCRTGDILDEEQAQAARKEDVLTALSQMASNFRKRAGESLATVEKHATPLAEATTSSLEALKAFSTGSTVLYSKGSAAALPLFKRAAELDPKFAMAHAMLGRTYGDVGETALSAEATTRAYQLRDRTTDLEKFFIAAAYDQQVTGNLESAQQTFELFEQTYPRAVDALGLLSGGIYPVFGKFEKAVEEAKKALTLNPYFPFEYINLTYNYFYLGRLDEAEKTLQAAADRQIKVPDLMLPRYDLAFLKGDAEGMRRAMAQAQSGVDDWVADHDACALAYTGRLQQARGQVRRAADLAQGAAKTEPAALYYAGSAIWEALFGNAAEARRNAAAALKISKARDVEYGAAFALALAGDSAGAQSFADDLAKRFPEDTSVRFSYLPSLHALAAVNRGDAKGAVPLLETASRYELGTPLSSFNGNFGSLYPLYVRGVAYLAARQGAEAAAEFQKIVDHPGIVLSDPMGGVARLQLARALNLAGNTAKAKTAYQEFLTLWKDADPDIPILRQAKAEYARL
ncbi:MAG TPA: protein kinase [Bryobacteraceae bacterium]